MDSANEVKLCQQALRSGDLAAARRHCTAALQARPGDPAALNLLGVLHRRVGRLADAEASFARALEKAPNSAALNRNLGLALLARGRADAALGHIRRALELQPESADAHASLARVCARAGLHDEALLHFDEAQQLEPDNAAHPLRKGRLLLRIGRAGEAAAALEQSRGIKAGAEVLTALAEVALARSGRGEAEALCRLALRIDSGHANALATLSRVLNDTGRSDEALAAARSALSFDPAQPEAMAQIAIALRAQGALADAEEAHRCARALKPDDRRQLVEHGRTLLALGRREEGWALIDDGEPEARQLNCPRWRGETPDGKTLLLHTTDAADAIQFCRYAPLLAGLGARIVVRAPEPLRTLMAAVEGVAGVERCDRPSRIRADFHCPMRALPRMADGVGQPPPVRIPYLSVPDDAPPVFIGGFDAINVGIAWRSDRGRSEFDVPLKLIEPALRMHGFHFCALDRPADEAEAELLGNCGVEVVLKDREDLIRAAAIASRLDLVICADATLAHLAAALGRNVWLLDHADGDWRWARGRENDDWYPTLRHFRQRNRGEWMAVTGHLAIELARLVGGERHLATPADPGDADDDVPLDPARIAPREHPPLDWQILRHGRLLCPATQRPAGLAMALYGEFCPARGEILRHLLRPGDQVVLGGAGFGPMLPELIHLVGAGAVHAFEAEDADFELLQRDRDANDWQRLQLHHGVPGNAGSVPNGAGSVDALGLAALRLLILDLERVDERCLAGASATIRRLQPAIYLLNASGGADIPCAGGYRSWIYRPRLYGSANVAGMRRNVFGSRAASDLLALPAEFGPPPPGGAAAGG